MQNIFDKNKAIPSSILDKNKAGAATRKHAYLLFHLQNYYANLVEEENYPKFYFSDNGIRRLKSGRLLMINHYNFDQRIDLDDIMNQGNVKSWKGRSHLTAMLSEDDGETWPYTLLLDERNEVSYPDAKEADNGYIYVTYDWERVTQREILMARFTEDDILRGKILSPEGKLRVLVNKALGQPDIH